MKRSDEPDSDWSDPGSTLGIADRYTQQLFRGLHITAGHNHRKGPDFTKFVVPEEESPWNVYALAPHPNAPGQWTWTWVVGGTAKSVALAKDAAERAALAWSPPTTRPNRSRRDRRPDRAGCD